MLAFLSLRSTDEPFRIQSRDLCTIALRHSANRAYTFCVCVCVWFGSGTYSRLGTLRRTEGRPRRGHCRRLIAGCNTKVMSEPLVDREHALLDCLVRFSCAYHTCAVLFRHVPIMPIALACDNE